MEREIKCPACARDLSEKQIGSLTLLMCRDGCGGIWFDTLEMEEMDRESEAFSEILFQARPDSGVAVDPMAPRACPRCKEIQLKRVLLNPGSQVSIHECPGCDGCWLDERELAKLHDERVEMMNAGLIEKSDSSDLLQYLFEVRTGRRKR